MGIQVSGHNGPKGRGEELDVILERRVNEKRKCQKITQKRMGGQTISVSFVLFEQEFRIPDTVNKCYPFFCFFVFLFFFLVRGWGCQINGTIHTSFITYIE